MHRELYTEITFIESGKVQPAIWLITASVANEMIMTSVFKEFVCRPTKRQVRAFKRGCRKLL